jgi:hypothetical protein
VKAGDRVKLIGVPPNVRDDAELQTRTLFEKCLGESFLIEAMRQVDGLPHELAQLNVGHVLGKSPCMHTIWVEEEYLQLHIPTDH